MGQRQEKEENEENNDLLYISFSSNSNDKSLVNPRVSLPNINLQKPDSQYSIKTLPGNETWTSQTQIITCSHCLVTGPTTIERQYGKCSKCMCIWFVIVPPLMLLPVFVQKWKDTHHYCQNCNAYLGVHKGGC